ncbi:SDR family NAD(P)-dependent oxidoreductase [Novosphingobium sp. G106]|uniref:SDR family NAD(P)-dependent oxidoreductase n=1 Tax=Novosphingobium sp. G106 TaxID=2849500 RepID=UPI001C2DA180|nr:SDR family NAD(P)-dependent oxidoreductase [Novosphingobium sp. G106]MBV1688772.1 SDR family NAD(P)-dependent oxidoreductase [Novosphingobium sp. G106]
MTKSWFVTGAGRGLGRAIAEAALARGDRVTATSRRLEDVADLADRYGERVLPLGLDIRNRAEAAPALTAAQARFGRIAVVVNNAARSLIGAVEEVTEAEARDLIDTNLLGTLWVTQAALPILREQGGGHVVQISSGGGVISWPMNGVYQASKWGIEGMSEALAQESGHLGIKVTIVQAGHMESGFARPTASDQPQFDAYARPRALLSGVGARKGNDPKDLALDLLKVIDAENPPLRVLLGRPLADIRAVYEERLAVWERGVG